MKPTPLRRRRRPSPSVRLALAGLVAVGGAYLIGLWVVGVVLIVESLFFVLVIWDDGKPGAGQRSQQQPGAALEAWRRSR